MSSRDPSQLLTPDALISAYAQGMFPMGYEDGSIAWFSPDPRGIIPLDEQFTVSRSLRKTVARRVFDIRTDSAFEDVLQACSERQETWITPAIKRAYRQLHRMGVAHSVEAWLDGKLVGGLYGVSLRAAFFGESMFSRATDASKVCLVHLVEHLRAKQFVVLDTQWTTPHLEQFGAVGIPRREYLRLLSRALRTRTEF